MGTVIEVVERKTKKVVSTVDCHDKSERKPGLRALLHAHRPDRDEGQDLCPRRARIQG